MNNVLFCFDKWCNANPHLGTTTHFHNFLDTFQREQSSFNTHYLHYDEAAFLYGTHIDNVLIGYCLNFKIDILFLIFSGQSPANPSRACLKKLKEHGVFIVVLWPDNNPMDLVMRKGLEEIVDLHVPIDNPKSDTSEVRFTDNKHLYLWTPENTNLYYPDIQDIPVSFVGSLRYPERAKYAEELIRRVPPITVAGGQRESQLSHEAYAKLIRASKIGINFCKNPMGTGYEQTKGRVFHVIASKSLLLEEKNSSTPDFFTPGLDYIEFENIDDLVNKIDYYLINEDERINIAERAYRKFAKYYTPDHFWDRLMSKIYELKG
jgi:glycosyltransferase involved in cell wall biosynthesis